MTLLVLTYLVISTNNLLSTQAKLERRTSITKNVFDAKVAKDRVIAITLLQ